MILVFGTILFLLEVINAIQPKVGGLSPVPPTQIGIYAAMLAVWAVWFAGFIKYSADKGYNGWVALCLALSSVPGFIALLIMPDIKLSEMISEATPDIASA